MVAEDLLLFSFRSHTMLNSCGTNLATPNHAVFPNTPIPPLCCSALLNYLHYTFLHLESPTQPHAYVTYIMPSSSGWATCIPHQMSTIPCHGSQ